MIKKNLFTSILVLCAQYEIPSREYKKGDIVIDHESNHNLYIFVSGWYTVWSESAFGGMHTVGEVSAPSVMGEGVFFGSFKKPVRVIADEPGIVYTLTEKNIGLIHRDNPHFTELLMRACLAVTNERILEANTERTLSYAFLDALETGRFGTIPTLLTTLKSTFSLEDALWIERHEILTDIFSIRYRESYGIAPVNERISIPNGDAKEGYMLPDFLAKGYTHIFPLVSQNECYGYLIFISTAKRLPGYVGRIVVDLIPNCIRLIESGWKKGRN